MRSLAVFDCPGRGQTIGLTHGPGVELSLHPQIFAGQPLPAMPIPDSAEQHRRAEKAAARIQRLWIYKNKARKVSEHPRHAIARGLVGQTDHVKSDYLDQHYVVASVVFHAHTYTASCRTWKCRDATKPMTMPVPPWLLCVQAMQVQQSANSDRVLAGGVILPPGKPHSDLICTP